MTERNNNNEYSRVTDFMAKRKQINLAKFWRVTIISFY